MKNHQRISKENSEVRSKTNNVIECSLGLSKGSLTPLTKDFESIQEGNNNMGSPKDDQSQDQVQCEEGPGVCALALTIFSLILIIVTLPLSLLFVVKVVQVGQFHFKLEITLNFQEYERAVIFRLGRLLTGGARGPGVLFVIPCVDVYEKIDMRSQTFEIPPQEVMILEI